jgi:predicted nucleotidyltransferase component of viral defense system
LKDHLLTLAAEEPDRRRRLNLVREYLQAFILRSLQDAGAFAALAFQGGTALRFLYGLRRFSEDLDFSLERPEHDRGLTILAEAGRRDLTQSGYAVEVTLPRKRAVQTAEMKFTGLLRETGLASERGAKLMIRIEVDTRPPAGAVLETRLTTRHFPITFRVHDLRSCMAGKVHAVLARRWAKGRDLFDLAWYLTRPDRPSPNLDLLRNALTQTGWQGPKVDAKSWRNILRDRVKSLNWPSVVADIEPFLEDPRDLQLLDREMLLRELGQGDG